MKKQEEVISSVEPNMANGKILFEQAKFRYMSGENFYTIEAAKKRKSKKEDDEDDDIVEDDDYYNNDEEDDNPFDKEPDENDLLGEDIPLEDDDDDLFDDEEDTYM